MILQMVEAHILVSRAVDDGGALIDIGGQAYAAAHAVLGEAESILALRGEEIAGGFGDVLMSSLLLKRRVDEVWPTEA
jgi:hypothetical protein